MPTHERKIILSLVAIYTARMLGLFLLFPVLMLFVEQYNFPAQWMAASIIGLYGLSQALMQIPMGWLSDHIGRRNTLLIGLALLFIGGVIAAYSDSAWGLFIGRLVQGGGAISAVAMALIADEISTPNRIKATALIGVSIGVSFVLAMLLSPMVASWFAGLRAIFAFSAALALVAMLLALTLPSKDKTASANEPAPEGEGDKLLIHSPLPLLCVGVFILHASLSATFLSVPGWLATADLDTLYHGWFYFLCLLVAAPGIVHRLRIIRTTTQPKGMLISLDSPLWLMLALLGLALYQPLLAVSLPWLAGLMIVYLYAFTVMEAALPAACMALPHTGQRGLTMGFFSSSQFLGSFVGGITAGLMIQFYSEFSAHLIGFVLMLAWIVWAQLMRAHLR